MNRRGFLGFMGAGAAAVAGVAALPGVASAQQPDDFTHSGYRVKWRGFFEPVNQSVVCGMWLAKHGAQDLQWVSTTLGQCYPSRDWEVMDMTLAKGWPRLTTFSSDVEREAVKQRALVALKEQLAK